MGSGVRERRGLGWMDEHLSKKNKRPQPAERDKSPPAPVGRKLDEAELRDVAEIPAHLKDTGSKVSNEGVDGVPFAVVLGDELFAQ